MRAGLTDPIARRAAAQLLARRPRGLARRRRSRADLETALDRLATAET